MRETGLKALLEGESRTDFGYFKPLNLTRYLVDGSRALPALLRQRAQIGRRQKTRIPAGLLGAAAWPLISEDESYFFSDEARVRI
jgi:hypothetical protein